MERKFGRNLASISPFEVTRTITCNTLPPSWGSSLRASPKKETGVEDCFLRRSCEGKKLLIVTPLYRDKITERNEAGVSPTPCGYICHHRVYRVVLSTTGNECAKRDAKRNRFDTLGWFRK